MQFTRRTKTLGAAVLALLVMNGLFTWRSSNAPMSTVLVKLGFLGNSLRAETLPTNGKHPVLKTGEWKIDNHAVQIDNYVGTHGAPLFFDNGGRAKDRIAVVSLGGEPTFGNAVLAILSLREHHICNALIVEGGEANAGYVELSGMTLC
jgi:hypothetical protein